MKSYYDILAVTPEVSQEEIKKSYRKLSKKYHPDLNPGNKEAETRFKEITEAYAVLSNQEARAEYNAKLHVNGEQTNAGHQKQQETAEQHYSKANINFGDMGRQFEQFFGFNPKTGERNQNFGAKQGKNKGPLDTSHIFESFFSPKKK